MQPTLEDLDLTSSFANVATFLEAARSAGMTAVAAHAGIGVGLDGHARISHDRFTRLFMAVGERDSDEALGLRLAMHAPLRASNIACYLFLSSPTLGRGIEQWVRFHPLITLASRLDVALDRRGATLCIGLADGALRTTRAQTEYYLGMLLRYMRWQTGTAVAPIEVRLRGRPRDPARYEELVGCPVLTGQEEDAILLSPATLGLRSVHACPEMYAASRDMAEAQLAALMGRQVRMRARLALRDITHDEAADLKAVAGRLNMSVRTLQRRLAEEGVSFQQLVDEHFANRARHLLADTATPVADIADACGFVDRRSFNRAFQRWTGYTPAHFRRGAEQFPFIDSAMRSTA